MRYCQEKGVVCQYAGDNLRCRITACVMDGSFRIRITNADRIRAMTDEELAVFLESSRGCPTDDDCEYGVHATPENCIKHWATWLQQPAEKDTQ